MRQSRARKLFFIIFVLLVIIVIIGLVADDRSNTVFAQEQAQKQEIGRYQFQFVPSAEGSAPSYIVFDTATGDFWQAKGFIENLDDFVVYSRSNLTEAMIGGHKVKIHEHK